MAASPSPSTRRDCAASDENPPAWNIRTLATASPSDRVKRSPVAVASEDSVADTLVEPEEVAEAFDLLQRSGKVKYREDIVQGIENAPRAFIGLLRGENFGKLQVQLGPDPTR